MVLNLGCFPVLVVRRSHDLHLSHSLKVPAAKRFGAVFDVFNSVGTTDAVVVSRT